jgi:hypothetical protein
MPKQGPHLTVLLVSVISPFSPLHAFTRIDSTTSAAPDEARRAVALPRHSQVPRLLPAGVLVFSIYVGPYGAITPSTSARSLTPTPTSSRRSKMRSATRTLAE